jgi:hypothetical protein
MDRFLVNRTLSPLSLSAGQMLSATALTLLAMPVVREWNVPTWRLDATLSLVLLGAAGTGLAYALNMALPQHLLRHICCRRQRSFSARSSSMNH